MTSFDPEEGSTEILGGSLGKELNGGGAENSKPAGKEDVSSLSPNMNDSAAVKPFVLEGDKMNEGATVLKSEEPQQKSAEDEGPRAPPLSDGIPESKDLSAKEQQPEEATVTSKEGGDAGSVKELKGDTELSAGGQPEKDMEMNGKDKLLQAAEGDEKDRKAEKKEKKEEKAIEKAEKKVKKAKEKGKDVSSTADGEKKEVIKRVDVEENEEKEVKDKDEEKQKKKEKKNLEKKEKSEKKAEKKAEKKDDGEKKKKDKKPKVASDKIQKKLEKINAKIGRILAKKEEYELRLKEAHEKEAHEKEAHEKELQDEKARERELQGKEAQERAVPTSDTTVPQQVAPSPADGHRAHYDRSDSGLRREESVILDGLKDGFKSHFGTDHAEPGAEFKVEDEKRDGEDEPSRLLGTTLQEGSDGKPQGAGQKEGVKEASNSLPKSENQPLHWETWIQRQREAVET